MDADGPYIYQYAKREGQTGWELEVLRRHYSRVTPAYGCRLVHAVLRALEDAAAHAPGEIAAAVKIQATFRMHQQRKAYLAVRHSTCLIQRVYRGYIARKRQAEEKATVWELAYLQTVFDVFATRIQACYRGYQCRKTRSNYYAQQAYLKVVAARSREVLALAHSTQVEQDTLRNAEAQRLHELSYARHTAHMHHMISTRSVPSVYQRSAALPPELATSQDPSITDARACDEGRGSGRVSPHLPGAKATTADKSSTGNAEREPMVADVATRAAGVKLENDIRRNARAARRTRVTTPAKTCPGPSASAAPSPGITGAVVPEAARSVDGTVSRAHGARLPAIASSVPAKRTAEVRGASRPIALAVPWEEPSTHPPQRSLTTGARPLTHPSPPQTAPSVTSSRPRHGARKDRAACPAADGEDLDAAGVAAGLATTAGAVDGIECADAAVSSFHRRFGVKRHDCLAHHLSTRNGVTSDGSGSRTFGGGTLSTAAEDAAVQRSVDQQVMQALHGDSVFKVPAVRGGREARGAVPTTRLPIA